MSSEFRRGGAELLRILNVGVDFPSVVGEFALYSKVVAGTSQLFGRSSGALSTIHQITPPGGVFPDPTICFVYRPGGVAGGNVFTDFAAVTVAMTSIEGCKFLEFDDSIVSPAPVPAGAFDMKDVIWTAFSGGLGGVGVAVSIAEGAVLTNLFQIQGKLAIVFLGATPPIVLPAGISRMVLNEGPIITTSGTGPLISVPNGAILRLHMEGQETALTTGTNEVIDVGATGIVSVDVNDDCFFSRDVISGVAGANAGVNLKGASATIAETQAGFAGTFTKNLDAFSRWDSSTTLFTTPGPHLAVLNEVSRVDPTGGVVAMTLPDIIASSQDKRGETVIIHNVTTSENTITITPFAGQTIDGKASIIIQSGFGSVWLINDGVSRWHQVHGLGGGGEIGYSFPYGGDFNVIGDQLSFAFSNGEAQTSATPFILTPEVETVVPRVGTLNMFSFNTESADATTVFKILKNGAVVETLATAGASGTIALTAAVALGDKIAIQYFSGTPPDKGNFLIYLE